ncbi:MAG: hypothetical protein JWO71_1216 [Candidatus Acidoferrum typicum]|nr:hypothetical protein [Candidatus Acidoferrum typicum]
MTIEIRNAALEARLQKQLKSTGSRTVEEVLQHLLETQEEQDRWLSENRDAINAKIRRGIEQLDRGEGIPDRQLKSHLRKLKTCPTRSVNGLQVFDLPPRSPKVSSKRTRTLSTGE